MRGQFHRRTELLWAIPFHQIMSTVGVLVLAGLLTFAISTPSRARQILTETPYFPVQVGVSFVVGFTLRRFLHHRMMQWVWLLPFVILTVSFLLTPLPFVGRLDRYFNGGCKPEFRCFVQLAVTLPFYTAVSYSLAAFLSSTLERGRQSRESGK